MSTLNRSRSCPVAGERRLHSEQAAFEKEEGIPLPMKLVVSQTAWDLLQQSRQAQAPLYLIDHSTSPPPPPWLRLAGIVELVGAAGTGKTQIALSLCRQAVRDGAQAIYLAVGGGLGPVLTRLRRMFDSDMLSRIWVRPVAQPEEWQALLLQLPGRLATCRVLILDDLARLVRTLDDHDAATRAALLFAWARTLRQWTVQFPHLVLVVVNQVVASDDTVRPACGLSWAHCVNSSFWVERAEDADATAFRRFLSLRKSPTYGMNRVEFRIEAQGVCLQDRGKGEHSAEES
jgi:Rad51